MRTFVTGRELARWREMREAGRGFYQIANFFGRDYNTVRYHLDPEYAEKTKARQKRRNIKLREVTT